MAKIPRLSVSEILAWADDHHARTGSWPKTNSGRIPNAPRDTWSHVSAALRDGRRGLPGGSSLCRLLAEQRGVRPYARMTLHLTVEQILSWADAYHARRGKWPRYCSGRIPGTGGLRWEKVDTGLRLGLYGLPGGTTLARLLKAQRGVLRTKRPSLTEDQILAWAKTYHDRQGHWPSRISGRIIGVPGETWDAVDMALRHGRRGLPGGCSLVHLLAAHYPEHPRAPLTEEQILAWADAYQARTGEWPRILSGPVEERQGLTWTRIDWVLQSGAQGLPGNSSLAGLLDRCRAVPIGSKRPPLTIRQILTWADSHQARHGTWPNSEAGAIHDAPGEWWSRVDRALQAGRRGLAGGSSLARLLAEHRAVPNRRSLPRLTVAQILRWADAHHERTGHWPTLLSGPIGGTERETWTAVNQALYVGCRGLPGGMTLARLLAEERGAPYLKRSYQRLTEEQVLRWAREHFRRTGKWPTGESGRIPDSSGETWKAVDSALRKGSRGLPGGSTLCQLLNSRASSGA